MDDKNIELNSRHGVADNILCKSESLIDALQLNMHYGNRFYPLSLYKNPEGHTIMDNSSLLFKGYDEEYNIIHSFFAGDGSSIIFNGGNKKPNASLPYHHILNLSNTVEDVKFRQEGVKELVYNPKLYQALENILEESYLYAPAGCGGHQFSDTKLRCDITPEKVAKFVNSICSLKDYQPNSGSLQALIGWAEKFSTDTLFHELLKDKRKVTDSRIIAIYTERFKGVQYGLLKPGVKPEDVFDFLSPAITSHTVEKKVKGKRKKKDERRTIVKYDKSSDESKIELAVGHARQRMDILNEISANLLAIPTYLMHAQMKHLYQGAYLYKVLKNNEIPVTFPKISDDPGTLKVKNVYPIRMVFAEFAYRRMKKQKKALNSFDFTSEDKIIQIEGPNKRGKSEAWRTLHLLNAIVNAGYPLAANDAEIGIIPNSHFISCKGESGHGGSELERSIRGIERELAEVYDGDMVILDELGDSTNAPTALEMTKRLVPPLINKGCKVYITSHHDALTQYISSTFNGISLMPNPNIKGVGKFRLVPSVDKIDYKPEETLDDMKFTNKSIFKVLPHEKRVSARIRGTDDEDCLENIGRVSDEDIPF